MDSPTLFPKKGPRNYQLLHLWMSRSVSELERSIVHPQQAQQGVFRSIRRNIKGTVSEKVHSLHRVQTLDEFRRAVPLQSYADIQPLIDRIVEGEKNVLTSEPVRGFVETSGTQSKPKLIPVTKSWSAHIRTAQLLWVLALLRDFPRISKQDVLHLVSSAKERFTPTGLPIGANTGRMVDALPKFVQGRFVLADVPEIADPDVRHYTHLRLALQRTVGLWVTANPSTLTLYARKLEAYQGYLMRDVRAGTLRHGPASTLDDVLRGHLETQLTRCSVPLSWKLAQVWPLSVVACWTGGPARWFTRQFDTVFGGKIPIRDVGITASEGYFALPLSSKWDGGILWNHGELLEFQDANGQCHWGWELEEGTEYQLIVSAKNGLLRYQMNDTVRVTGRVANTPIISFVGKSGRFLNAVGEKVTEEQLSLAMGVLNLDVVGFSGRIQYREPSNGMVPNIRVVVECTERLSKEDCRILATQLDASLQKVSVEYRSKRQSQRLGELTMVPVQKNTYEQFRYWRVEQGASFAQVKDCIIATDREWAFLEPRCLWDV